MLNPLDRINDSTGPFIWGPVVMGEFNADTLEAGSFANDALYHLDNYTAEHNYRKTTVRDMDGNVVLVRQSTNPPYYCRDFLAFGEDGGFTVINVATMEQYFLPVNDMSCSFSSFEFHTDGQTIRLNEYGMTLTEQLYQNAGHTVVEIANTQHRIVTHHGDNVIAPPIYAHVQRPAHAPNIRVVGDYLLINTNTGLGFGDASPDDTHRFVELLPTIYRIEQI